MQNGETLRALEELTVELGRVQDAMGGDQGVKRLSDYDRRQLAKVPCGSTFAFSN
jgi:hypothetical protein